MVVDPGGDAPAILWNCKKNGLEPKMLLLTHAHFDHVLGLGELHEATGAPVFLHPADRWLYENAGVQAGLFDMAPPGRLPEVEVWLHDGQILQIGALRIKVMHTPGHSPGSVCFLLESDGVLFSGDTIFAGGVGRTDLWGASHDELIQSIRTRISTLPQETRLIPGHGPESTVGEEMRSNPFLQGE